MKWKFHAVRPKLLQNLLASCYQIDWWQYVIYITYQHMFTPFLSSALIYLLHSAGRSGSFLFPDTFSLLHWPLSWDLARQCAWPVFDGSGFLWFVIYLCSFAIRGYGIAISRFGFQGVSDFKLSGGPPLCRNMTWTHTRSRRIWFVASSCGQVWIHMVLGQFQSLL